MPYLQHSKENIKKLFLDFRTLIGTAISLVLLWVTLRESTIQWKHLMPDSLSVAYFAGGVLVFVLTIVLHALRTKLLWVKDGFSFSSIRSYASLVIGNFYNCILPGNLGEAVRGWHFHRRNRVPLSRSLAAIVTEKWVDAQLLIPILITLYLINPPKQWHYIYTIFLLTALAIVGANIVLAVMWLSPKYKRILFAFVPLKRFRHPLYRVFVHLKSHISGLAKTGWLWGYCLAGYAMFSLNLLHYFLLFKAGNVQGVMASIYPVWLVGAAMVIISVVPSAPSSVGVMHYGIYTALCVASGVLGVELTPATTIQYGLVSVYMHLSYFIPEVILGVVFVVKERKWLF